MKKLSSLILIATLSVGSLFAQKAAVVGTVNMERVLADYAAYQSALERIAGAEQTAQEEIDSFKQKLGLDVVESQIQELQQKSLNPAIADAERQAAAEEAKDLIAANEAKIRQLNDFGQQLQDKTQQARQSALNPYEYKARDAVNSVAKDKNIDLVFPIIPRDVKVQEDDGSETEYSFYAGQVMFASDALEITDAVIAILNAE
ncbi:MAG: OmpH family outer membrane protein [Opitutales bacterium]